jgi:CheY-like chemotaxis protein
MAYGEGNVNTCTEYRIIPEATLASTEGVTSAKVASAIRLPGSKPALLRGAETILLVEDEAFVRAVTGEVLKSAGYQVLEARNGCEAMRVHAETRDYDLLLADVILPGEDGRALASRIKRENPRIQILLVTGYAEQMEMNRAGQDRWDCLPKPFSSQQLLRRVRQALDGNRNAARFVDLKRARACGSE